LISVKTPLAVFSEIHSSEMKDGVMEMRAVPSLALPAGRKVELKPGGFHVMLTGLSRPIGEHDVIPLVFTFESARGIRSTLEVKAKVRPLGK
jgi:copper(I)-binding protein